DDAGCVCLIERKRELAEERNDLPGREVASRLEHSAEIRAFEELHHDEGRARVAVDVGIERLHDVIALNLGGYPGFKAEPCAEICVQNVRRQHHLKCSVPARLLVEDVVYRAHAACLEATGDLIPMVKTVSDGEGAEPRLRHGASSRTRYAKRSANPSLG